MDKVRVTKTRKTRCNNSETYHETTEDFADLPGEMKNQVKHFVKGSSLGNGKFLLAVAWVTKESKLMHIHCPWLLGGAETFLTNAKKRPLTRLCEMNTNNEILPFVNVFIPSAQKCVFHWL